MHILKIFLISLTISTSFSSRKFKIPNENEEKDSDYWYKLARKDLDFAFNRVLNTNVAKNIIFFLGDGLGITVNTAGRIFKGQKKGFSGEEEILVWEKFPNVALAKTYNLDKQVPDSAATGTAFLGGVKGNYYTIGLNGKAKYQDCKSSLSEENRVKSILSFAQEAGKDTGFVTSTRLTHATPAALYAHSADRYWECDADFLKNPHLETSSCKDIARQLVEEVPGRDMKVIFGGGRRQMGAMLPGDEKVSSCLRNDSRNLVEEWLKEKGDRGKTAKYVTNSQQLKKLESEGADYIMGLFGGSHMPYNYQRDKSPEGTPELKDLTRVAVKQLKKNPKGFFLLVEGGRIDHSLHDTKPHPALDELLAFEEAVSTALELTNDEDTLIIVTADHSHVMTINGYPSRGNDILGITANDDVTDNLPYSTLMFSNGPGAENFTWDGSKVVRSNLTGVDTTDFDFFTQAAVPVKIGDETHGGEDVAIYASGPMSHLFHRVHEQSYVAHVMARAACIGPYTEDCRSQPQKFSSGSSKSIQNSLRKPYFFFFALLPLFFI